MRPRAGDSRRIRHPPRPHAGSGRARRARRLDRRLRRDQQRAGRIPLRHPGHGHRRPFLGHVLRNRSRGLRRTAAPSRQRDRSVDRHLRSHRRRARSSQAGPSSVGRAHRQRRSFRLSRDVRRILDAAGLHDAKIMASGDLDEVRIARWSKAARPSTPLASAPSFPPPADAPSMGAIYKLVELETSQGCAGPPKTAAKRAPSPAPSRSSASPTMTSSA